MLLLIRLAGLFISKRARVEEGGEWCLIDNGQVVQYSKGVMQFTEMLDIVDQQSISQVVLFVSPDICPSIKLAVPSKRRSIIRQTVPFLMEEKLVEDIDEYHIVCGKWSEGKTTVYYLPRSSMDFIKDFFSDSPIKLTHLVPEQSCFEERTGLFDFEGRYYWVNEDGTCLIWAEGEKPIGVKIPETIKPQAIDKSFTEELFNKFDINSNVNLLSGDYAVSTAVPLTYTRYKWRLMSFVFSLLLLSGVNLWQGYTISNEAELLRNDTEVLFKNIFPNDRIVNIAVQFKGYLRNTSGQNKSSYVIGDISRISKSLDSVANKNISLKQLQYSYDQPLILEFKAKELKQINQLINKLEQNNFQTVLKSASNNKTDVLARLELSNANTQTIGN